MSCMNLIQYFRCNIPRANEHPLRVNRQTSRIDVLEIDFQGFGSVGLGQYNFFFQYIIVYRRPQSHKDPWSHVIHNEANNLLL